MLESELVTKIIKWLREQGCVCWKNHGSIYMPPGLPDIVGLTDKGLFFGIEVKTEKGKTTQAQEQFLMRIADNNGIAFVARNVYDVKLVMSEYLVINS